MGDSSAKTLLYPAELKYVKTHEFIRANGAEAVIGITAFAADQLGDVTYVELPKVGSKYKKEDKFGVIESVKSVSELYMPLAGEVVAVNDRLASEPELVNLDCYNEGWMLKLKLDNPKDVDSTMSADDYKKFVVE
ncbi:MAG: glycine cleavage system protein GcvH [Candidatus Obscuribacterales bacterium]|nr:glycine cleavage system protein GcvH [Candidatus Obscuribacterales bacterium]